MNGRYINVRRYPRIGTSPDIKETDLTPTDKLTTTGRVFDTQNSIGSPDYDAQPKLVMAYFA